MKVFESAAEFREWRHSRDPKFSVGFVATMGALHAGHAKLIKQAAEENDLVVLSIFVNPTQFNQASDLEKYPRTIESDLELARSLKVTAVFLPRDKGELYPDDYRYRIRETEFSEVLCGAHRPGHFEGVLTVVMKLFAIVNPTRAYFGEKDYQQVALIEGMARAFFLPVKIVKVATEREKDGLAMSSRNARLGPKERLTAPRLYAAMREIRDLNDARSALEKEGFRVDYLEDRTVIDGSRRRFAAAYLGDVRLIDNIPLEKEPS
jgi:pantoate--beta-alanine ligase